MYIARTGTPIVNKDIRVRFYILDENNSYKNIGGRELSFPLGTAQDAIDTAIAQTIKTEYETRNGVSPLSLVELKQAGIQPIGKSVQLTADKLLAVTTAL